ncbi:MAG: hypothetical protein FWE09_00820 [Treponema sp.]|nr:hypothetical protein [Treponema sp.]
MIKKVLIALVIAATASGAAFAEIRMSAGAGGSMDMGRIGGMSVDFEGVKMSSNVYHTGFGGFVFLDATYVEFSTAFMFGPTGTTVNLGPITMTGEGSFMSLDFGLLGRFPFELGAGNISVFPLLGVGYSLVLSTEDPDGNKLDKPGDFSSFRIMAGVGADFDIGSGLFIRAQALGRYSFAPKVIRENGDQSNVNGGFGALARVGLGFRF